MKYTEEEKKAIKECESLIKKEYYGDMYFYERRSIQIVLNLIDKQQKEIERLGGLNIVIGGMRSGKNLLSKIASDYVESASKEIELQSVSGYTIDFVIDLFKRGFVLVNEKEFKNETEKRIDKFFDNILFVKDINELKKLLKEKLLGE